VALARDSCRSRNLYSEREELSAVLPINRRTITSEENCSREDQIHKMSDAVEVTIHGGKFAEDKDAAKELRKNLIMPSLAEGKRVIIDFSQVTSSTQSFVHALIAEPLQKLGEDVLEKLEFHACAPQVRTLVELVVDYSLGGFTTTASTPVAVTAGVAKKTSEKPVAKPSQLRTKRT